MAKGNNGGSTAQIERHPLQPFLPDGAGILFLGSFPPPAARWSMEFFYPNFINDFWRIMGRLFFGEPKYFEASAVSPGAGKKGFDKEKITAFAEERGLAFYDTAAAVRRLKGNASDAHLEIVEPTDVAALLDRLPLCHSIVTTGGKASEEMLAILGRAGACEDGTGMPVADAPAIGNYLSIRINTRNTGERLIRWWRMPSTSRAYPLPFTEKAAFYSRLFDKTL